MFEETARGHPARVGTKIWKRSTWNWKLIERLNDLNFCLTWPAPQSSGFSPNSIEGIRRAPDPKGLWGFWWPAAAYWQRGEVERAAP